MGLTQHDVAPLITADSVVYDAQKSTPWSECYLVPSQSQPGSWRKVVFDVRAQTWRCSCPATVTDCAHIKAAMWQRRLIWHRNAFRGVDDLTLRKQDKLYAAMHAEGTASPDDYAGWEIVGDMIGEGWVAA